jgi:hypothetical protein
MDGARALAIPVVECGAPGEDPRRRWTQPFTAAVRSPSADWCLAIDRVRYTVAGDRYPRAAHALEIIAVTYCPLPG